MSAASRVKSFLQQTFEAWNEDSVPQHGAALAFYSAFSMAPLLVISLRVVSVFFGDEAARGEIVGQMQTLIGEHGSRAVQDMIVNAREPTTGMWATLVSVVVLFFGASGVFAQLQTSLNAIWSVKTREDRSWWDVVRDRFLSFGMVVAIAFLLLASLVVSAVLDAAMKRLPEMWGGWSTRLSHLGLSFVVVTLLFAMVFKVLPDVKIRWRDVWIGAVVTAVLFTLGKVMIGWYLSYSSFASSYGLAGSFMVLLFWIYYSAQILFLGAEMTQVYARQSGRRIVARENAEPDRRKAAETNRRTEPADAA